MPEQIERRLTTIMAADVAEYTRLMRADEEGTFSALTDFRTIVEALIARHRGRVANTAGDSLLADFPSVVEGLSCALADLYVRHRAPWHRPEDYAHMLEGLRKAGWQG